MDKGFSPSVALVAVAVAAMCVGCSIKEDRSLCPCSLALDFSDVEASVADMSEVYISAPGGFLYHDEEAVLGMAEAEVSGEVRRVYSVDVPKTQVDVSVVSGAGGGFVPGKGISIRTGEQCPPVFLHYSRLDAVAEWRIVPVKLRKDYCRIDIRMLASAGEYPFRLTVKGNVCGINADRSVAEGNFSYSFVPDSDGSGAVRVPRQLDNSLVLQVLDGDRVLREFALGEYIAESGFDWTQEDLADVGVEIDYANSYIKVKVAEWSGSFGFDIVI